MKQGKNRTKSKDLKFHCKTNIKGFPGGSVVKNPPASEGDMGSIPGQGTKTPHTKEQLSPCATTIEPVLWNLGAGTTEAHALEPEPHNKRSHAMRSPCLTARK